MKITVHLEGKNRLELAEGLRAHLALIEGDAPATGTGKAKPGKRAAPEKTVSPDEDEDFGDKKLDEEDLKDEDEEAEKDADESEDEDESNDEEESEDEDEEEEAGPSFDEVRKAVNKYGKTHPKEMKTILLTFNIKNLKELQAHAKKWEPVLRKTNLAMKKLKKK